MKIMFKEFSLPLKTYINRLFHLASEKIEADSVHMFLLSDGSRIDENEYLSSLEHGIELIV